VPTSRLTISIIGGQKYRHDDWKDGTRQTLEEALPLILQEVGRRAAFAEQARIREDEARRGVPARGNAPWNKPKFDCANNTEPKC
jgi:hypothetical protein